MGKPRAMLSCVNAFRTHELGGGGGYGEVKVEVGVGVCVCVRERERERESTHYKPLPLGGGSIHACTLHGWILAFMDDSMNGWPFHALVSRAQAPPRQGEQACQAQK